MPRKSNKKQTKGGEPDGLTQANSISSALNNKDFDGANIKDFLNNENNKHPDYIGRILKDPITKGLVCGNENSRAKIKKNIQDFKGCSFNFADAYCSKSGDFVEVCNGVSKQQGQPQVASIESAPQEEETTSPLVESQQALKSMIRNVSKTFISEPPTEITNQMLFQYQGFVPINSVDVKVKVNQNQNEMVEIKTLQFHNFPRSAGTFKYPLVKVVVGDDNIPLTKDASNARISFELHDNLVDIIVKFNFVTTINNRIYGEYDPKQPANLFKNKDSKFTTDGGFMNSKISESMHLAIGFDEEGKISMMVFGNNDDTSGGRKKKTKKAPRDKTTGEKVKYNGRQYSVRIGAKGGRYIIVADKKKYIRA